MTGGKGQIPKFYEGRTYLFAFGEKCGMGGTPAPQASKLAAQPFAVASRPLAPGGVLSLPMTGA